MKEYFFGLHGSALESVLTEYGRIYGSDKEAYARETLPRWRTGKRRMSGLVAKRLFDLLPPRMPVAKKYELAENIWRHFGPRSVHAFTVGPEAPVSEVAEAVASKLDEVVTRYSVPANVQNRFSWLASGDVKVKEQLLNHFRQMEKRLAVEQVLASLPVLQRQVRDHAEVTGLARTTLQVHKHQISISVDKRLDDQFREGEPERQRSNLVPSGGNLIWWFIAGIALLVLILQ